MKSAWESMVGKSWETGNRTGCFPGSIQVRLEVKVRAAEGRDHMTPGHVKPPVTCDLHHAHLFAGDLGASVRFYQEMFRAEVVLDDDVAGARNVLLRLGSAYINFYDQPPKNSGRGIVHHLGIRTTDLASLVCS
jgi:hypothetical protein